MSRKRSWRLQRTANHVHVSPLPISHPWRFSCLPLSCVVSLLLLCLMAPPHSKYGHVCCLRMPSLCPAHYWPCFRVVNMACCQTFTCVIMQWGPIYWGQDIILLHGFCKPNGGQPVRWAAYPYTWRGGLLIPKGLPKGTGSNGLEDWVRRQILLEQNIANKRILRRLTGSLVVSDAEMKSTLSLALQ